ncbi:mg2+ transporter zinc transport protein [Neofusicoccum parvum]|uniref:Mg2+ transporter zinc transport protein n=1 Tax=Neofusicoccum parvum TaxID=310453 RepID=A0ACB5RTC3_9PEZI|nr:mg2+ transporter zinc transport protein [Neofusicoccum parvum]
MRALQSWRRRTMTSLRKLSTITHFLHHHHRRRDRRRTTPPTEPPAIHTLLADFRHIAAHVADSGRRLERALPVVPSVLQLAEGRLALREARGAARLARLALVFVPLSFAAGLFGMDAAFAPGGPRFWVYVAVAAPLTALVCAVARLSAPAGGGGGGGWGSWRWRFLGSGTAGA